MNGNGSLHYYIIPSDNWEQQPETFPKRYVADYIIPSDNWEQQLLYKAFLKPRIISYQAITGNNNTTGTCQASRSIISYQAITGNNNS